MNTLPRACARYGPRHCGTLCGAELGECRPASVHDGEYAFVDPLLDPPINAPINPLSQPPIIVLVDIPHAWELGRGYRVPRPPGMRRARAVRRRSRSGAGGGGMAGLRSGRRLAGPVVRGGRCRIGNGRRGPLRRGAGRPAAARGGDRLDAPVRPPPPRVLPESGLGPAFSGNRRRNAGIFGPAAASVFSLTANLDGGINTNLGSATTTRLRTLQGRAGA